MKTIGGYLIGRIKLMSGRILNKMLHQHGLHEFRSERGKILYALWQEDGLCCSELSRRTGLALNTLSNMLDSMERQALIHRAASCEDKRKKRVYLSEKGRSLEAKTAQVNEKMNALVYKGFQEDEILQFEAMLQRIIDNLTEVDI